MRARQSHRPYDFLLFIYMFYILRSSFKPVTRQALPSFGGDRGSVCIIETSIAKSLYTRPLQQGGTSG